MFQKFKMYLEIRCRKMRNLKVLFLIHNSRFIEGLIVLVGEKLGCAIIVISKNCNLR